MVDTTAPLGEGELSLVCRGHGGSLGVSGDEQHDTTDDSIIGFET